MIDTVAIVGIASLVAIAVYFWKRSGIGSGRRFGNRIAAHLGIPRNVFRLLMAHGTDDASRNILAELAQSSPDLDQAGLALAPVLAKGIQRMETRFGRQTMVDEIKPVVARLVGEAEKREN